MKKRIAKAFYAQIVALAVFAAYMLLALSPWALEQVITNPRVVVSWGFFAIMLCTLALRAIHLRENRSKLKPLFDKREHF
jgi:hypothetical protein